MKNVLIIILIFAVSGIVYSQERLNPVSEKLLTLNTIMRSNESADIHAEGRGLLPALLLLSPFNPMMVIENEKAYFALTKETSLIFPLVSFGKKTGALGKIGFEYSYVFRSERRDHIRTFFELCYPLEAGDFAAILVNLGGGYFTDTKKAGLFPQASLGLLVPFSKGFSFDFYFRTRETFALKKEESNIFDLSLGIGIAYYPW